MLNNQNYGIQIGKQFSTDDGQGVDVGFEAITRSSNVETFSDPFSQKFLSSNAIRFSLSVDFANTMNEKSYASAYLSLTLPKQQFQYGFNINY